VAGVVTGAARRTVAQSLPEGAGGVLEGVLALFVAGFGGTAEVVAALGAEVLVDGLGDDVGDHRLEGRDERLLRGFQDRVPELLRDLFEDLADEHTSRRDPGRRAQL
jgi:hypothetical protein